MCDADYLDLEVPAHITFDDDRLGVFQFGAMRGGIDHRSGEPEGKPAVDFSWESFNDTDAGCGRGWAVLVDRRLEGRLFLRNGDDSFFAAQNGSAVRD